MFSPMTGARGLSANFVGVIMAEVGTVTVAEGPRPICVSMVGVKLACSMRCSKVAVDCRSPPGSDASGPTTVAR